MCDKGRKGFQARLACRGELCYVSGMDSKDQLLILCARIGYNP